MKVILQRDIPKLGKSGDIKEVADGYGRNYLLPRDFAVLATGGALKDHDARLAREKDRGAKLLASAQTDAAKLEGLTVTIIGKVGAATKLYGSITSQDVSDEIVKATGVAIDKRRVGLPDPIKTLGVYTVPVRLHSDVIVPVTVDVTTEVEIERRKVVAAAAAAKAEAEAAAKLTAEGPAEVTAEVEATPESAE